MEYHVCGLSDVGRQRQGNEDYLLSSPENGLFIVADGMGGHAAGEVASKAAVEAIKETCERPDLPDITPPVRVDPSLPEKAVGLLTAVWLANQKVYHMACADRTLKGMGTTIVAALLNGGKAYIASVGDSRAYKISRDSMSQITKDHSLVREQVERRIITEEKARTSKYKNILTRSLGAKPEVEVDMTQETFGAGDYLLMCSDGLTGEVEDDEIRQIVINSEGDIELACKNLIQLANERGGVDNITVIILKFTE